MRNMSYYLALLAFALLVATVLVPMSITGRTIMIVVVVLSIVMTGVCAYLDHNEVSSNNRLLVMILPIVFVLSILEGIASLFWAPMSLSIARANSGVETEASLMVVVFLVSFLWAILSGSIIADRRKQPQKSNVPNHK